MLDEDEFPALFGMTELGYAPIDARFVLLDGGRGFDERLVAHINVMPFVGDQDCIVVGFDTGDWTVPGGTLEPGEHWRAALERELLEEAGAYLRTYTPFAVLQCRSRAAPYRPHLPHPDFYRLLGYGDVDLGGAPAVPAGGADGRRGDHADRAGSRIPCTQGQALGGRPVPAGRQSGPGTSEKSPFGPFFSTAEADHLGRGHTLDLYNPADLRLGASEFVSSDLPVEHLAFIPMEWATNPAPSLERSFQANSPLIIRLMEFFQGGV